MPSYQLHGDTCIASYITVTVCVSWITTTLTMLPPQHLLCVVVIIVTALQVNGKIRFGSDVPVNYAIWSHNSITANEEFKFAVQIFDMGKYIERVEAWFNRIGLTMNPPENFWEGNFTACSDVDLDTSKQRKKEQCAKKYELTTFTVPRNLYNQDKYLMFTSHRQVNFTVRITDSGKRQYVNSTTVTVRKPQMMTYIQTDKSIYKPGETVKYRVFTLNNRMQPYYYDLPVAIKITDGAGNLVDKQEFENKVDPKMSSNKTTQNKDKPKRKVKTSLFTSIVTEIEAEAEELLPKLENPLEVDPEFKKILDDEKVKTQSKKQRLVTDAVMQGSFKLSDKPVLGTWKIDFVSRYGNQKTFTVAHYVLPKFDVEMELPKFVQFTDSSFQISVIPKYTFNKPVSGVVSLEVALGDHCYQSRSRWCRPPKFVYRWSLSQTIEGALDGVANFEINLNEWREKVLKERNVTVPNYRSSITTWATASFKEQFTGITKNITKNFLLYREQFTIQFAPNQLDFFLPGFEIPMQLKVLRPNNLPMKFKEGFFDKTYVIMKYYRRGKPMELMAYFGRITADADNNAVANFKVKVPMDADFKSVTFVATLQDKTTSTTISPFVAICDEYVTVKLTNLKNKMVQLSLTKSSRLNNLLYILISRDRILDVKSLNLEATANSIVKNLQDKNTGIVNFVPDLKVVVCGNTEDGEFVAGSDSIDLSSALPTLNLTTSKNTYEVGQKVTLSATSNPNSVLYLLGIDHSVNLMKTGHDITTTKIVNTLQSYTTSRWWPQNTAITTEQILQQHNLVLLSDGFYMKKFEEEPIMRNQFALGSAGPMRMESVKMAREPPMSPRDKQPDSSAESDAGKVRSYFPESFIWTDIATHQTTGKANYTFAIPDTITSWDITGFSLNNKYPMQAMDKPYQVVSFKSFFISPVLPYSLIRGEEFILKVLIFNYLGKSAQIEVTVPECKCNAFSAIPMEGQVSNSNNSKAIQVMVQDGNTAQVMFRFKPNKIGTIRLTISGKSVDGTFGDTMIKKILVIPEGKVIYKTSSLLLKLDKGRNGGTFQETLKPIYPGSGRATSGSEEFVAGSEDTRIQVIGDVMGAAMQNVQSLLRMPYGCGEQNMINFAPAVFIHDYLKEVNQLSEDVKQKTRDIMKTGYQRELTYKRRDGSYSAFGNSDPAGSTWLTAFVLKIYAMAASTITIDPKALVGSSLKFLIDMQGANGAFNEPPNGRIIHRGLQGNARSSSVAMTAYICTTLMQLQKTATDKRQLQTTYFKEIRLNNKIDKCLTYINEAYKANPDMNGSLDVALSAYTTALALKYRYKYSFTYLENLNIQLMKQLEDIVEDNSGGSYLSKGSRGSVEATSYYLLAAIANNDTKTAFSLLKWLNKQQNSNGGFGSTQETVVGLQALSEMAKFLQLGDAANTNAQIKAIWGGNKNVTFDVTADKRTLLKTHLIGKGTNARTNDIRFTGIGNGIVLVTLAWQYNVLDKTNMLTVARKTKNGISLRLKNEPEKLTNPNLFSYSICTNSSNGQGMYIVQVTHPTGFEVSSYTKGIKYLKSVETDKKQITFYLEELTRKEMCLSITWERQLPVLKQLPQQISVQSYYQTELENTAFFLYPGLDKLTECQVCPECSSKCSM